MTLPLYQVDAFASQLFAGNPAAVVYLDKAEKALPEAMMQAIAAENNLSETAFVMPEGDHYHIRWFTPTVEVDLCGHATLASAHVLFRHLNVQTPVVSFTSRSGMLHVRQAEQILYLDFPANTPTLVSTPEKLATGLGVEIAEVYRGKDDYLAIVASEETVRNLNPDLNVLIHAPSRAVIVSSQGQKVDFVSRVFGPRVGIPEDPVTGSAHTLLTPYWSQKLGKTTLQAKQVSARGGELSCRMLGDRVEIGGQAVTYLIGEISVS